MQATPEPWETFDKETLATLTPKSEASMPDPVWSERIGSLPVGNGFRIKRQEGETVRQLKKRINRAAGVTFRTLEWYPEQKNVATEDVTSFVVKVRALDLKAKATAEAKAEEAAKAAEEAAKNSANGQDTSQASQEAPQPTGSENAGSESPEQEAPVASRRTR